MCEAYIDVKVDIYVIDIKVDIYENSMVHKYGH